MHKTLKQHGIIKFYNTQTNHVIFLDANMMFPKLIETLGSNAYKHCGDDME